MRRCAGFTLIELLVVVAIIGVLAIMVLANWKNMTVWSQRSASLNNLKQIGVATFSYAGDNNSALPKRVTGTNNGHKWPALLSPYLEDIRVYAAVGDHSNYIFQGTDPLSDTKNNTSFIMNGYSDLGAYTNQTVEVRLTQLEKPAGVILFGTPKSGMTHFYMDLVEPPHGNQNDVLNLTMYGVGSDYLFADGSARFISTNEYNVNMWLVNKDYQIPQL